VTKISELPWIGEFNKDWPVVPNKALIKSKKDSVGLLANSFELLSLTKQGVIVRNLEEGGKFPENFDSYQQVVPGNLVTCLFDVEETPRTIGLAKNFGMITGAYDVFEFTSLVNPRFFEYYYLALDDRKGLKYFYSGLRNVIRTPVFLAIPMPLPPREEQDSIVEFLDHELAHLDLLATKLEALLKSLDELRAAIIDDALEQLKVSKFTKIKYACELNKSRKQAQDTLVDFFPMDSISEWQGLRFGEYIDSAEASSGYSVVRENDVVIAKVTPCFENRKGTVISQLGGDFALATTEVLVLTPSKYFESKFIRFVLASSKFIKEGERAMTGAGGLKRIPSSFLANFMIPEPTLDEQKLFVEQIETKMEILLSLESALLRARETLKTKRVTLTSAAVTGVINVSGGFSRG
jgi:type I restriction enzyme S subunit